MNKLAIERGHFILASGLKSDIYVDARPVYLSGEGQFLIGELFYEEMCSLEKENERFDACGGMAMGAIPLACALSQAAYRRNRELPCLVVRDKIKDHGLGVQVEGMKSVAKSSRVLLLEDVVTTAASSIKAKNALANEGYKMAHLLALVDREQGGKTALQNHGVSMRALFTLDELRK